jgi:hypothetical protein
MGNGTGQFEANYFTRNYIYFEDNAEWISISRPQILAQNIVFGTLYIDLGGTVDVLNHKSGAKGELKFKPKSWSKDSEIIGSASDASGSKKYEIRGSWKGEIFLKSLDSGVEELVWTDPEPPADFKSMFCFSKMGMILNYLDEDLKAVIPITDSRQRNDIRLWEQGQEKEADEEKIRLEIL